MEYITIIAVISGISLALLAIGTIGRESVIPAVIATAAGIALFLYTGGIWVIAFSELGLASVAMIHTKKGLIPAIWGIIMTTSLYLLNIQNQSWVPDLLGFAISSTATMFMVSRIRENDQTNYEMKGKDGRKETLRDVFQIAIGVIMAGAGFVVGLDFARVGVLAGVLGMLVVGNVAYVYPNSAVSRRLWSMERESVFLGLGAMWIAISSIIAAALSPNLASFELCILVIFVSDSVATIVGVKYGKTKLYRGSRKSLQGLVSHGVVSTTAGFLLLGYAGALIGLVSSMVEGFSQGRLDDNLTTGTFVSVAVMIARFL